MEYTIRINGPGRIQRDVFPCCSYKVHDVNGIVRIVYLAGEVEKTRDLAEGEEAFIMNSCAYTVDIVRARK
jgi:hypothetical protein